MTKTVPSHAILKRLGLGILKDVLPNEHIEDLTRQWYPKMRRRALTVATMLGLLVVAQIQNITYAAEELLQRCWIRTRSGYRSKQTATPVTRQAFSLRLKILPWQIFRGLFSTLLTWFAELMRLGEGLYHNMFTIQAIDGSVVDVAARLLKAWAGLPGRGGGRSRKAQAKVHAMFNVSLGVPTMVTVTGAKRSERRQARKMLLEAVKQGPTIIVTDLGYFAFAFFARIMKTDGWFVARLKGKTKYQKIKRFGRRDFLVRLGVSAKGQTSVEVRLVGVREGKEIYWYLTNLMPEQEITPKDIRLIYRKRWSVELFFKSWKHALRGGKFFCYNTNGIKIQIYASLCSYLITRILVVQAAQRYRFDPELIGFDRAASVVRCWMLEYWGHLWCLRPRRKYLDAVLERIAFYAFSTQRTKKTG
jgi:hypothetical protein